MSRDLSRGTVGSGPGSRPGQVATGGDANESRASGSRGAAIRDAGPLACTEKPDACTFKPAFVSQASTAPTVLVQCAVILVAFGEMFTLNVPLTLVTACSLPITFVVGVMMRKRMYPVSWLIQARLAEVAMLVEENVEGVRVVKSFAAEQNELVAL